MNQRPIAGDPGTHDSHGHTGDVHDDHHDCPDCEAPIPYVRMQPKVGRNDPCNCGSGRKFKKCCGA